MTGKPTTLLLRIARVFLYSYLFAASLCVVFLGGRSLTALLSDNDRTGQSLPADLVTIKVRTARPHELTGAGDAIAGFTDGVAGRPEKSAYLSSAPFGKNTQHELLPDSYEKVLRYREPSGWKRLLLLNLGFTSDYLSLQLVAFLFISALLLVRILNSLRRFGPFTAANARRICWLGVLLIATDAYQGLAYWIARFVVPPFVEAGLVKPLNYYVVMNNNLDYGGWLAGVILLLIAAVYQRGVDIYQEAELTV